WCGSALACAAGSCESFPTENLEHFFLDRRQLFFRESRVNDLVQRPRPHTAQQQEFLASLGPRFLKPQPLAPHQQQGDNVAKVDAPRLRLAFQALKAVHQQIVVDPRLLPFIIPWKAAQPEAERIRGWALPRLQAVVLTPELATLVQQDRVTLLARPQFPPGGGTAARVGLDLILRHGCLLPVAGPVPSRFYPRRAVQHHPILSAAFHHLQETHRGGSIVFSSGHAAETLAHAWQD